MTTHKIQLTPTAKMRTGDFLSTSDKSGYWVIHPDAELEGETVGSKTVYRMVEDYLLVRHESSGDTWPLDEFMRKVYRKKTGNWLRSAHSEFWLPTPNIHLSTGLCDKSEEFGLLTFPKDYVGGIVEQDTTIGHITLHLNSGDDGHTLTTDEAIQVRNAIQQYLDNRVS